MASLEEREWTLMFYFASDTPLAPEVVSQLKSIKQAGFHNDVNVVAQFDPHAENAETHIFDVNRINKIQARGENKIGFVGYTSDDPYVVNLMPDKLWRDQKDTRGELIRKQIIKALKKKMAPTERKFNFDPPIPPPFTTNGASNGRSDKHKGNKDNSELSDELIPEKSLESFLRFCSDHYPARHYMLFILGHGLVVGNDTFLFDEHAPEHFLKLKQLSSLLKAFKKNIQLRDGVKVEAELELVSFHSCSMSSLEVAAELQGIANYMLASQSPSFVASWPYRQILIRIFNYMERKGKGIEEVDVKGLLKNFFHYCLYNSYDFLVAGYSCDACLCDLNKVPVLQDAVDELSKSLVDGLRLKDEQAQELVRERVLLAHLDSQSYFLENYTDLYDFCFRLQRRIEVAVNGKMPVRLRAINEACKKVMEVLEKGVEGNDERLIVRSDFVGPAYQYSHGLSVYFPWSKPLNKEFWPLDYNDYEFVKSAKKKKQTSWSEFLEVYFKNTTRKTRALEFQETSAPGCEQETGQVIPSIQVSSVGKVVYRNEAALRFQDEILEAFSRGVFNNEGELSKPNADSSQGDGCTCQSIKNFPQFTLEARSKKAADKNLDCAPSSQTLLHDTSYERDDDGQSFVFDNLFE